MTNLGHYHIHSHYYFIRLVPISKSLTDTDTDTWRPIPIPIPIPIPYKYVVMMIMVTDALPEVRSKVTRQNVTQLVMANEVNTDSLRKSRAGKRALTVYPRSYT